jgi:gliding motility-associated-like protein
MSVLIVPKHRMSLPTMASRCFVAFLLFAVSNTGTAQLAPIQVRFEPRCDLVTGYFSYSGTDAVSYAWTFSDGGISTLASPVRTFPFGTEFTVTLDRMDANGELVTFSTTYLTQDQLESSHVEFPNVFSPNGDGVNDQFTALNDELLGPCAELRIYNRYGQLLFESPGGDLRWDGTSFAGEQASSGIYFYAFTWGTAILNSTVTLVR